MSTSSEISSAPCVGELDERTVEPGRRRHDAHVRGRRLDDDRGDAVAVLGERSAHRIEVVVRQHEREAAMSAGTPAEPGSANVARPDPA